MRDVEQYQDDEEAEINLTPMLDVVFIMLIFFIVTAVFVKDPGIEVSRPDAVTAITPEREPVFSWPLPPTTKSGSTSAASGLTAYAPPSSVCSPRIPKAALSFRPITALQTSLLLT